MPKFPEPPSAADLAAVPPRWRVLPAGTELWRLYVRGGRHPAGWRDFRHYGPVPTARFDHHLPPPAVQARGILYAASFGPICVAEVFQATRTINLTRRQPWLVGFALAAPVTLLDLTGLWPTAAGASMALATGQRARARRWSQAIYAAYPAAQGLWYPSSMYGNRPAVALYERAAASLPAAPFFHRALDDPLLRPYIVEIARAVGYRLVARPARPS